MTFKSVCEAIIAVIILVFALAFWSSAWTQWVIVIAAIVLLIHSLTCHKCFGRHEMMMNPKPASKRRR